MSFDDIEQWYKQTEALAATASHLIGMRAESVNVLLRPGITRPEAILACIRSIAGASEANAALAASWKSLMPDGTLFLSLPDWSRPYCTVAAFITCRSLLGGGLSLAIDIHVPMGVGGDPTPYRIESSTAYIRGTQSLFPVLSSHVRESKRSVEQQERSGEQARVESRGSESAVQREASAATVHSSREAVSAIVRNIGWKQEGSLTSEKGSETRTEAANRDSVTSRESHRSESSFSSRERRAGLEEKSIEASRELTHQAVGLDMTAPSEMLKCWIAYRANSESAALVETLLHSASGLAEAIPEMVAAVRSRANLGGAAGWSTHALDDRFWEEASKLIVVEHMGCPITRQIVEYDGLARPMDTDGVRRLGSTGSGLSQPLLHEGTSSVPRIPGRSRSNHGN